MSEIHRPANSFDLMRSAMTQAKNTMGAADDQANVMAGILEGRLRKVSPYKLAALKKELKDFNARTGEWK